MALFVLVIAVIFITAAVRNSQAALFAALKTDVPAFGIWAAAIVAVGLVGYIPGLKPVSRGLLGLIILVIVVNDYQEIISGFEGAWEGKGTSGSGATATSTSGTGNGLAATASSFATSAISSAFSSGLEEA